MSFPESAATARLVPINREQIELVPIDIDSLIPEDHPARAIWEFVGRLNLEGYLKRIKSVEGAAGRPAFDPRLLASLWIFAYSEGVSSAREIENRCGYHPAYQWLTGRQEVNHHTLSDFRGDHEKELDKLFTDVLGLLSAEGLITLEQVMQDGTKVKAFATSNRFRREDTIKAHLAAAAELVRELSESAQEETSGRIEKARVRAARERKERLEEALDELKKLQETRSSEARCAETRVSETDPEARMMKQSEGGYAPSYNVQFSTDAANSIIVNVDVTQGGNDAEELSPAVTGVERRCGEKPKQVVADGSYTNRETIIAMEKAGIDFIGSMPDRSGMSDAQYKRWGVTPEFRAEAFVHEEATSTMHCPAGCKLRYEGKGSDRPGVDNYRYRAHAEDCRACAFQTQCCPQMTTKGRGVTRQVEAPTVVAFRNKMETEEAKAIYRRRSPVAEFTNAWIKTKNGLRQFRLRGLRKTKREALWAALAYNLQQWTRLVWKPRLATTGG